jgi:TPR repeat protein
VAAGDRYSLVLWLADCEASVAARAAPWLRTAADAGSAYAQFLYAEACKDGRYGVERDAARAVEYQRRAAAQGHALSQHRLGLMYFAGREVPKCPARCLELWRAAAEGGLAAAQVSMAACYANGYLGVQRDEAEARVWYERAARQGDAEAAAVLRTWGQ